MRAAEQQVTARIAALFEAPGTGARPATRDNGRQPDAVEAPRAVEVPLAVGVPSDSGVPVSVQATDDAEVVGGWVPAPPAPEDPDEPDGCGRPARPRERSALGDLQARALTSAMAAYTAAHGHQAGAGELDGPRTRRWRLRARAGVVAAVALLALGGAIAARAAQQTPSVTIPAGTPSAVALVAPEVVVHVVGQVASPGLVRLPEGSRVADAVDAAGGAAPGADLATVNLARVLVDGEQVVIGLPGQPVAAVGSSGSTLVDLNAADEATLDGLPGIGPVLAGRIVDWRTEHGPFTVVDELGEVTGIGPALLAGVRDLVRVG